jgi:hypothetical protein
MNILRIIIVLLLLSVFGAQAQENSQRTAVKRAEIDQAAVKAEPAAAQVKAVSAKPARSGMSASDKISAKPGTVLTLCCGSVDPQDMTGSNCAYMHTGQGCAGFILACPEGSKDTVTEDGSGYCKEGG